MTSPASANLNSIISYQDLSIKVKRWFPKKVLFTAEALKYDFAQKIYERIKSLDIEILEVNNNRLSGIKGRTDAETYRNAKSTLAIVKAPDSMKKLLPIPPSADYQFHLAHGCPAHCQYCYLAGSLQGLPVVKAFGNLQEILENSKQYDRFDQIISYEVSCYTDPLALEYLTGSLSETIQHFSNRNAHLRFVTKFDEVTPLLKIKHGANTRARFSVNASEIVHRYEGGAAPLENRIFAATRMITEAKDVPYPIGLVIAPILPVPDWEQKYSSLMDQLKMQLSMAKDITFEFITHRFTGKSKNVLNSWYPNSQLPMDLAERSTKFNKFGGVKYVYKPEVMGSLKDFFYSKTKLLFPQAKILYWT